MFPKKRAACHPHESMKKKNLFVRRYGQLDKQTGSKNSQVNNHMVKYDECKQFQMTWTCMNLRPTRKRRKKNNFKLLILKSGLNGAKIKTLRKILQAKKKRRKSKTVKSEEWQMKKKRKGRREKNSFQNEKKGKKTPSSISINMQIS